MYKNLILIWLVIRKDFNTKLILILNSTSFRIGNEICPSVLGQKGSKNQENSKLFIYLMQKKFF